MASDIARVVVVGTAEPERGVRACLQSFGHINRIVFWKKGDDGRSHYFVEFLVRESVDRACKFRLRDFRVHPLTSSKLLVDAFAVLTSQNLPRSSRPTGDRGDSTQSVSRQDSAPSARDADRINRNKSSNFTPSTPNGLSAPPLLPAATIQSSSLPPKPVFASLSISSTPSYAPDQIVRSASDQAIPTISSLTANALGSASSSGQAQTKAVPPDDTDTVPAYLSVSSGTRVDKDSIIPNGLPPLRTTISMSLCGERIHYNLATLDEDPATIIRLLKMTGSDRDCWMIVASRYRRTGKVHAAILVVSKMLEVMKANGMTENDLRPAFLMLASCHTEIRRRVTAFHGRETDESRAQSDRARSWLQKVHGFVGSRSTSNGSDLQAVATTSSVLLRDPITPAMMQAITRNKLSSSTRELQLLQDRHASQLSQLAEVIAGKRKAEDATTQERVQRRRLEREKDELERQLALAQEREQRALEQVHRELVGRLNAEELAAEEQQQRIEAQKGAAPLLEALAAALSRAASGTDVSVLAASILQAVASA